MTVSIREGSVDDIAASIRLLNDIHPTRVTTEAGSRHESRRTFSAYTGTLRAYRGRGLARLAKLGVMRRLAELGVTLALTENDETNAPMLAINQRLGYRPMESRYSYVLDR
jgi:GNAT superfamily N-acetyltransferase